MSLTKLKDIAFKLAYDHYEAESCKTADADKLALAIRAALEAERERCAKIAEDERVDADDTQHPADIAYNDACKDIAKKIREG